MRCSWRSGVARMDALGSLIQVRPTEWARSGAVKKTTDGPRELAGLALLLCVSMGCNHQTQPDCLMPTCPLPVAIVVSATSAAGGPVPGLTLTLSGAASGSGQCTGGASATSCVVPGMPGAYNLQLTAAGFQDRTVSVVVAGSTPQCGCTSVETQQVSVVLTPSV
jgi:hypothetical protein